MKIQRNWINITHSKKTEWNKYRGKISGKSSYLVLYTSFTVFSFVLFSSLFGVDFFMSTWIFFLFHSNSHWLPIRYLLSFQSNTFHYKTTFMDAVNAISLCFRLTYTKCFYKIANYRFLEILKNRLCKKADWVISKYIFLKSALKNFPFCWQHRVTEVRVIVFSCCHNSRHYHWNSWTFFQSFHFKKCSGLT